MKIASRRRSRIEKDKERRRLRRAVKACGILLASTVFTEPLWTNKQLLERRRLLSIIPRVLGTP